MGKVVTRIYTTCIVLVKRYIRQANKLKYTSLRAAKILKKVFSARIPAESIFCLLVIIMTILGCIGLTYTHAAEIQLEWEKPDPDIEIDGYIVYYAEDFSDLKKADSLIIPFPDQTACVISDLEEGRVYYFAATSFKKGSYISWQIIESDLSEAIKYKIPGTFRKSGGSGGGCIIITIEK